MRSSKPSIINQIQLYRPLCSSVGPSRNSRALNQPASLTTICARLNA